MEGAISYVLSRRPPAINNRHQFSLLPVQCDVMMMIMDQCFIFKFFYIYIFNSFLCLLCQTILPYENQTIEINMYLACVSSTCSDISRSPNAIKCQPKMVQMTVTFNSVSYILPHVWPQVHSRRVPQCWSICQVSIKL